MRVVKLELEGSGPASAAAAEALAAPPAPPLVLVTWRDAFFDFDQSSPGDVRADYLVRTVGFLVADGPVFVSLAQEILPDDEGFRAVTHIPCAVVEGIVPLDRTPDDDAQVAD